MSNENEYRLVVCLDVKADNLKDAYRKVLKFIRKTTLENPEFDCESSDEWFDADGTHVPKEKITQIRMEVFHEDRSVS